MPGGGLKAHCPLLSSTCFRVLGLSVMIPSTPRSSNRSIVVGSSIVQTWTATLARWHTRRKLASTMRTLLAVKAPGRRPRGYARGPDRRLWPPPTWPPSGGRLRWPVSAQGQPGPGRAPVGEGGHEHSVDRGGPLQYVHDGGDGFGRLDVDVPAHGGPGRQQFLQKGQLAAVGQLGLPYLRPGHLGQQARTVGHPVERRVVQGHRDAVSRCSDVCLQIPVSKGNGVLECGPAVFRRFPPDPPRWAKAIGPSWSRKGKAAAIAPQRYRAAAGSHTPKLR